MTPPDPRAYARTMRRHQLLPFVLLLPLALGCGSEPSPGAPNDAAPDAAPDTPRVDAPGELSEASTEADAAPDARPLDASAADVVEEDSPAMDAAPDAAPRDAFTASDIGPPPSITTPSEVQRVRVALRVESLTPGAPAAVYTEASGVHRYDRGSAVDLDFTACGPSGCRRVSGTFSAHVPPVREAWGIEGGGLTVDVSADVEASEVYTVMRAAGPERLRNYVARIASPATSTHGAVTGIAGATASVMVGEVWLIGAPAVAP